MLGPLEAHLTGLGELSQLVAERGALRDIFDRYREKVRRVGQASWSDELVG